MWWPPTRLTVVLGVGGQQGCGSRPHRPCPCPGGRTPRGLPVPPDSVPRSRGPLQTNDLYTSGTPGSERDLRLPSSLWTPPLTLDGSSSPLAHPDPLRSAPTSHTHGARVPRLRLCPSGGPGDLSTHPMFLLVFFGPGRVSFPDPHLQPKPHETPRRLPLSLRSHWVTGHGSPR